MPGQELAGSAPVQARVPVLGPVGQVPVPGLVLVVAELVRAQVPVAAEMVLVRAPVAEVPVPAAGKRLWRNR